MAFRPHLWLALAAIGLAAGCLAPAAPAAKEPPKPAVQPVAKPIADPATRWESEILAYEKRDKESPPPAGATLFVGSSTIRVWSSLVEDFRPMPVIGRGVGGCQVPDMVYYADRVAIAYKPARIVFYAGDNDIAGHRPADQVAADFRAFVEKVRRSLPDVPIFFLAIKPSPSRAAVWDEAKKANAKVRDYCQATPHVAYIDVATPMLGPDGKPRPELFQQDMLHMNRAGYDLWVPLVKAAIEKGA